MKEWGEKLERDLASEINKDDLTDEPFTESEMDINIKNEKNDDNDRYPTKKEEYIKFHKH